MNKTLPQYGRKLPGAKSWRYDVTWNSYLHIAVFLLRTNDPQGYANIFKNLQIQF